jgi:hypothetical protein
MVHSSIWVNPREVTVNMTYYTPLAGQSKARFVLISKGRKWLMSKARAR